MQLERGEVLGLAIALAAVAGAVAMALTSPGPAPETSSLVLPPIPDTWPRVDRQLLVELPDSGGCLANGAPLDPNQLATTLQQIERFNPWMPKGILVRIGKHRPITDLRLVLQQARNAGWQAFDAARSGWPDLVPPQQIPPPSANPPTFRPVTRGARKRAA